MSRLIDADEAIKALSVAYFDKRIQSAKDDPCVIDAMIDWAIRTIKAMPTIDAVEVVRCKDCKFGVYEKGRGIYHIRCEILEFLFQDDDYCSYGERREE